MSTPIACQTYETEQRGIGVQAAIGKRFCTFSSASWHDQNLVSQFDINSTDHFKTEYLYYKPFVIIIIINQRQEIFPGERKKEEAVLGHFWSLLSFR